MKKVKFKIKISNKFMFFFELPVAKNVRIRFREDILLNFSSLVRYAPSLSGEGILHPLHDFTRQLRWVNTRLLPSISSSLKARFLFPVMHKKTGKIVTKIRNLLLLYLNHAKELFWILNSNCVTPLRLEKVVHKYQWLWISY